LFTGLEEDQILDPDDELDIWCLHLAFLPKINMSRKGWVDGWIMHPLRTEHNKTPLQLWIEGLNRNIGQVPQEEVNLQEIDRYGIDWEGPVGLLGDDDICTSRVELPETGAQLMEDQLQELHNKVDQISYSCQDHVILYLSVKDVVREMLNVN